MDLNQLWGLGLIPLIVALVEVCKQFIPDKRFYPLIAVILGMAGNVGIGWAIGESLIVAAILGLIAGLAACGLYSTGATINSHVEPPAA